MNRLLKIFLSAVCLFSISCKKYDDGPAFSLMSKKGRISNVWKVESYYLNGNDETDSYRQLISREKLTFFQSGSFEYSEVSNWVWAVPEYTGSWKLVNKKEDIEMVADNSQVGTKTYHILRLKNNQLWLERQVSPDSLVEYHYSPLSE